MPVARGKLENAGEIVHLSRLPARLRRKRATAELAVCVSAQAAHGMVRMQDADMVAFQRDLNSVVESINDGWLRCDSRHARGTPPAGDSPVKADRACDIVAVDDGQCARNVVSFATIVRRARNITGHAIALALANGAH